MAITRQVITSLTRDGADMLGIANIAVKIIDESIVSGSLLTVESNHFCVLKSRGAVLNVYETGQYALTTPDKPLIGSIVQGFFGGSSPWVYEVIYVNRSKLLVSNKGVATSAEMAEVAYRGVGGLLRPCIRHARPQGRRLNARRARHHPRSAAHRPNASRHAGTSESSPPRKLAIGRADPRQVVRRRGRKSKTQCPLGDLREELRAHSANSEVYEANS